MKKITTVENKADKKGVHLLER